MGSDERQRVIQECVDRVEREVSTRDLGSNTYLLGMNQGLKCAVDRLRDLLAEAPPPPACTPLDVRDWNADELIAEVRRGEGLAGGGGQTRYGADAPAACTWEPPTTLNAWREVGREMQEILRHMSDGLKDDLLPDWFAPRLTELLAQRGTGEPPRFTADCVLAEVAEIERERMGPGDLHDLTIALLMLRDYARLVAERQPEEK